LARHTNIIKAFTFIELFLPHRAGFFPVETYGCNCLSRQNIYSKK